MQLWNFHGQLTKGKNRSFDLVKCNFQDIILLFDCTVFLDHKLVFVNSSGPGQRLIHSVSIYWPSGRSRAPWQLRVGRKTLQPVKSWWGGRRAWNVTLPEPAPVSRAARLCRWGCDYLKEVSENSLKERVLVSGSKCPGVSRRSRSGTKNSGARCEWSWLRWAEAPFHETPQRSW